MQKKVLYIITKSNEGGAQRYVYDLATRIGAFGYSPFVACGGNGVLVQKLTASGVPVIPIPSLQRNVVFVNEVRAFFSLLDIIRSTQPDVVHVNSSKAGALGALAARFFGVRRIIFTIHGWAFREKRPVLWRALTWVASLITLYLVTDAIAVSARDYADSPRKSNVRLIHNGISRAPVLARSEALKALGIDNESRIIVGVVAELMHNKGIDVLLEALRAVPTVYTVIIGDGEERAFLEERARRTGISSTVRFLGHVPNAHTLMKGFDIVVIPSRKEGLPYTLLEAGAAERAVVASAVGGIPELIIDGKTGMLVPSENPRALAAALAALAQKPDERERLGRELAMLVHAHHEVETMVQTTLSVYQ